MPTVRLTLVVVSTAGYVGLAVLGLGGLVAFFSHPALIALAVVLFIIAGASAVSNARYQHMSFVHRQYGLMSPRPSSNDSIAWAGSTDLAYSDGRQVRSSSP